MGSGSPVVMIHGLVIGNLASWYFRLAPVVARTHQVVLYDLRGHGRSERVMTGYDLDNMADDLSGVISQTCGQPVYLVGHSYGCLVALRYALDHPGSVDRLVLVDAPLPPACLARSLSPMGQSVDHLLEVVPDVVREAMAKGSRQAKKFFDNYRFLVEKSSLITNLEAEPDFSDEELSRLQARVLCLYGNESFFLPTMEKLKRALHKAETVVLPGSHYLPNECPDLLAARIEEFLND